MGQRGRVVDTVADEGDLTASLLKALHCGHFAVREDFSQHLVDTELLGDSLGGAPIVAGNHRDAQTELVERRDGGGRRVFDGVSDRDDRRELPVHRSVQGGFALVR